VYLVYIALQHQAMHFFLLLTQYNLAAGITNQISAQKWDLDFIAVSPVYSILILAF